MKDLHEKTFELRSELANGLPHAGFSIFEARPKGAVRGGIVLIQEIFGVNNHIRSVARHYASLGFAVWAPSYFDHFERGVELSYEMRSFAKGRDLVAKLGWEQALDDTRLAAEGLRDSLPVGRKRVAALGFCWGGSLAWLAACRLGNSIDAAVSYYGRQAPEFKDEQAKVPAIMHFGRHDPLIPMLNVEAFQRAQPGVPVFVYEAGHGFNCNEREDYNPEAAKLAEERTLGFLAEVGI